MIKIVKTTSRELVDQSIVETDSYCVVETDDDGEHHVLKKFGPDYQAATDYWWSLLTNEEQADWSRCFDLACKQ
jgi:hypothetical protein